MPIYYPGTGASVAANIAAAGTTQATATAIAGTYNIVTAVAANAGVRLSATQAATMVVLNRGANTLTVYPISGQAIESLGANAGYQIAQGGVATFVTTSATQVYVIASQFQ